MTVVTKRVSGAITESSTKRVNYFGTVTSTSGDTWGGSWANSWANSWTFITVATAAQPAVDITKRVASGVTANITKRI